MIRFTKEEKIVLLFLLASLFIGTTVHHYKKLTPKPFQCPVFDEKKTEHHKKININTATKNELVRIKRIGPVLAERIIAYREEYGPFKRIEEIKNVKGIGKKTFELMREDIVLE